MKRIPTTICFCILSICSNGQRPSTQPNKSVAKPATSPQKNIPPPRVLSAQELALSKLLMMAKAPADNGSSLLDLIDPANSVRPVFNSTLQYPGAISTTVNFWHTGYAQGNAEVSYIWKAVVAEASRADTTVFEAEIKKQRSIIEALLPGTEAVVRTQNSGGLGFGFINYTIAPGLVLTLGKKISYQSPAYGKDEIYIELAVQKKIAQERSATADLVYRTFSEKYYAAPNSEAAFLTMLSLWHAVKGEGLTLNEVAEKCRVAFSDLLRKDQRAAFKMFIALPIDEEVALKKILTEEERQVIARLAKGNYDDYIAQYNPPADKIPGKSAADELCQTRWKTSDLNRGVTRTWGIFNVILESYDCEKDRYRFWIPKQDADPSNVVSGKYETDNGDNFRRAGRRSMKQYYLCSDCEGDGYVEVTEYTTKTKELPWGYFSGIETKKITTTSTVQQNFCKRCRGRGVIMK